MKRELIKVVRATVRSVSMTAEPHSTEINVVEAYTSGSLRAFGPTALRLTSTPNRGDHVWIKVYETKTELSSYESCEVVMESPYREKTTPRKIPDYHADKQEEAVMNPYATENQLTHFYRKMRKKFDDGKTFNELEKRLLIHIRRRGPIALRSGRKTCRLKSLSSRMNI